LGTGARKQDFESRIFDEGSVLNMMNDFDWSANKKWCFVSGIKFDRCSWTIVKKMRRTLISLERQRKRLPTATLHKPISQPEKTATTPKTKKTFPLIQPTVSPYVWASGMVEKSEIEYFEGTPVHQAAKYFEIHGPQARFIPPSEFSYEVFFIIDLLFYYYFNIII
jgi:hypothetical protein